MINNIVKTAVTMLLIVALVMTCGCIGEGQDSGNDIESGDSDINGDSIIEDVSADEFIYKDATMGGFDLSFTESTVNIDAKMYLRGYAEIDQITITDNIGDEDVSFSKKNTFTIKIVTKEPANPEVIQSPEKVTHRIPLDVSGLEPGEYRLNVNGAKNMFVITENGVPQAR